MSSIGTTWLSEVALRRGAEIVGVLVKVDGMRGDTGVDAVLPTNR